MRKVCPQCSGKGRYDMYLPIIDRFLLSPCLDCNQTGYIEVSEEAEESCEEAKETANADNQ